MDPELLALLAPNRLPDAIGRWPLAPGWYLLALLILIIGTALSWQLLRWHKRRYRRQALVKVQQLADNLDDPRDLARAYNRLLKEICLHSLKQPSCTALSESRWAEFLQKKCPRTLDKSTLDALCHYANPNQPQNTKLLHRLMLTWIKAHHV